MSLLMLSGFTSFSILNKLRTLFLSLDSKEVLDLGQSQPPGLVLNEFDMFSLPEGVSVFVKCVSPLINTLSPAHCISVEEPCPLETLHITSRFQNSRMLKMGVK